MWKKPAPSTGAHPLSNLQGATGAGGVRAFGLQLPKSKQTVAATAGKPPVRAFSMGDDDDDDGSGAAPAPAQLASIRAKKYAKEAERVLAEAPDAFSYDETFDAEAARKKHVPTGPVSRLGLTSAAAASAAGSAPAPAPAAPSRYISALLNKAAQRKLEADAVYERNLLKERAADDALHAGKEKFLTAGFRAKLAEQEAVRAKQEEQDRRDEAAERLRARGGAAAAGLGLAASRMLLESRAAGPAGAAAAAEAEAAPISAPAAPHAPSSAAATPAASVSSKHARSSSPDRDSKSAGDEEPSAKRIRTDAVPAATTASSAAVGFAAPAAPSAVDSAPAGIAAAPAAPAAPTPSIKEDALASVAARLTSARNPLSKAEEAKARLLARKQQQQPPK